MTTDTLSEICARKREHIAAQRQAAPEALLLERALHVTPPRGFHSALRRKIGAGGIGLIAEVKKASPSKGLIREDFAPAAIATAYERGGATCISVLTDAPYFQGADAYLIEARAAISLPVLRKDFMLDPYQVIEARSLGADAILLIMAALSDTQAADLELLSRDLGMDVLVEVHDEEEVERALKLDAPLIGINNRSLKTLEVDLANAERLRPLIPEKYTVICESGIHGVADIDRMRAADMHGFLIGESLMRQNDIEAATRALLAR